MATDTRDWSGLATRTLDSWHQRRDLVDAHPEDRQREDDALQRFAVAAVAIDEAWTEGARRVQELERQAEQLRDQVRARTERLEFEQATAVRELLRLRPMEDLATMLGMSVPQLEQLARDLADVPLPRTEG